MAINFTLFDKFLGALANGEDMDLANDTIKAILTNALPSQTAADEIADITQIANGNGYTTGGVTIASQAFTEVSAGVWGFDGDPFAWTSADAGMAEFQYIVLTNVTTDMVIGWADHGSGVTLPVGSTYTVTPHANGFFRITRSP